MKTLLLLRHAKSDWSEPGMSDFARPLNKRGQKAAPLMGEFARKRRVKPDLVLSSPAERARQTALRFVEAAGYQAEVRFDERIYEANWARLLEIVQQFDESSSTVLMVGHNPGMEDLLLNLTGNMRRMPTAALARVNLAVDGWNLVVPGIGQLEWLVKPKDLDQQ